MRPRHTFASFVIAFYSLFLTPLAYALEAATASSHVTLIADVSTPICPATTNLRTFGDRLLPNGTRVRFTVPDGQVLVVTSLEWVVEQASQFNDTAWVTLDLFDGTRYQHALIATGHFDFRGRAAGNTVVPDGVVVRSGTAMCFGFDGSLSPERSFARIHGFLARDA